MGFITNYFGSQRAPKSQRPTVAFITFGILLYTFSFMAEALSLIIYQPPPPTKPHEPHQFPLPFHILQILSIILQSAQIPILHLAVLGFMYRRGRTMGILELPKPGQKLFPSLLVYAHSIVVVFSFIVPPVFRYLLQWQWPECIYTPPTPGGSGDGDASNSPVVRMTCDTIWSLFNSKRRDFVWGACWSASALTDSMSLACACAMFIFHRASKGVSKHYSKTITYALFLTPFPLLCQSSYIFLYPFIRQALFEPLTDITYFDIIDAPRGTFWLCVYLLILVFFVARFEWPSLREFEETEEMAQVVDTQLIETVGSLGAVEPGLSK